MWQPTQMCIVGAAVSVAVAVGRGYYCRKAYEAVFSKAYEAVLAPPHVGSYYTFER